MEQINAGKCNSVRPIKEAQDKISKACAVLNEAVGHVVESFGPVLRNIPTTENKKEPKGIGGSCEYETLIGSTVASIYEAAEKLNEICERSAV